MNNKLSINIILFIMLSLLAVTQVVILNKYSTTGDVQVSLTQEIKKTVEENDLYSQRIASYSAVATISQKALSIGLNKQINSLSLTVPVPVAYNINPSL